MFIGDIHLVEFTAMIRAIRLDALFVCCLADRRKASRDREHDKASQLDGQPSQQSAMPRRAYLSPSYESAFATQAEKGRPQNSRRHRKNCQKLNWFHFCSPRRKSPAQ